MSFKICVIGCGEIARGFHGPVYKRYAEDNLGQVELVACSSRRIENARKFAVEFGFLHAYDNYVKMLDIEQPDVVCLNVPPSEICTITCDVLKRRIPILLEKPPGLTTAEIDLMIEEAEKGNVPNQVAFNRRYMPLVIWLNKMIQQEFNIKQLQSVGFEMTRIDRREADFSTTAIHGIDLLRMITNSDYLRASFDYQELSQIGQGIANYFIEAEFSSGIHGQLSFYPLTGKIREHLLINLFNNISFELDLPIWSIKGHSGLLKVYQNDNLIRQWTSNDLSNLETATDWWINGFWNEDVSFFESIRHGRYPEIDLRLARQSVVIMEKIRDRKKCYIA